MASHETAAVSFTEGTGSTGTNENSCTTVYSIVVLCRTTKRRRIESQCHVPQCIHAIFLSLAVDCVQQTFGKPDHKLSFAIYASRVVLANDDSRSTDALQLAEPKPWKLFVRGERRRSFAFPSRGAHLQPTSAAADVSDEESTRGGGFFTPVHVLPILFCPWR